MIQAAPPLVQLITYTSHLKVVVLDADTLKQLSDSRKLRIKENPTSLHPNLAIGMQLCS